MFTPNLNANSKIAAKGRRYIPNVLFFDKSEFNEHIKVLKAPDGALTIAISPLFKTALGELQRGRSTKENERKKSTLAKLIQERIPSTVRSILKKTKNKINNGYYIVDIQDINYSGGLLTLPVKLLVNPVKN